jgi:hypothetical protein
MSPRELLHRCSVLLAVALAACGGGGGGSSAGGSPVATCTDGVKNGAEIDVDCGGGTCSACATGKACLANAGCTSNACLHGACVDPCGSSGTAWDSDGDGVPDATEGRCQAQALDSDGDGTPDYLATDSDGDGAPDAVEFALYGIAGARDPVRNPAAEGITWVLAPYAAAPSPAASTFAASTRVPKVDVGFVVDTTGSMGGTIAGLRASLSTLIVPTLKTLVPDVAVGIAGQDDFPYGVYGAAPDLPFYVASDGYVTTVTAASQNAANGLATHGGSDGAESQIPALYTALTGAALAWPGGSVPATLPPAGTFGALRFRSDAAVFLVSLTDVGFHNGKVALDKTGTGYASAFHDAYSFTTFNADDLVTRINALGVRLIGGAADGGARALTALAPYADLAYLADQTGAWVDPSVFTTSASCAAGQCCTGAGTAGVSPDGPTSGAAQQCRLVFSYASDGTGVAEGFLTAFRAALADMRADVRVRVYDDAGSAIDVVGAFVQKIEPAPGGGTDGLTGAACAAFPPAVLSDGWLGPKALVSGTDGVYDTIGSGAGRRGPTYCFNLAAKANATVAAGATHQVHKAWVRVEAPAPSGFWQRLGPDRPVVFVVPPAAP